MPVSGGGKIRARLAEMRRKLRSDAVLKVGFLEGASYGDGTPVAMVAAIQEFGAPNAPLGAIPPRPFFRTMIREKSGGWAAQIAALLRQDYDVRQALQAMGLVLQGELKQSIADLTEPPLSDVTLLLREWRAKDPSLQVGKRTVLRAIAEVKGGARSSLSGTSAKPLIDSGTLIGAVDFSVDLK